MGRGSRCRSGHTAVMSSGRAANARTHGGSTADGIEGDRRESNPDHQGHNLECTNRYTTNAMNVLLRTCGGTRTPNVLLVGQALFH
jgi:hypothetical protein